MISKNGLCLNIDYDVLFVLKVINKILLMADVSFAFLFSVVDNDISILNHKIFLSIAPSVVDIYLLMSPITWAQTTVMASSAMGLNCGSSGFFQPHTQKQTQHRCVHDLCVPCSVLRVFVFTADCSTCS